MPLMILSGTPDPWASAADRLNRHASQDPSLGRALANLSRIQSHQLRLATKIEEGRVYGLRQEVLDMRLKRKLDRMTVPTQEMW